MHALSNFAAVQVRKELGVEKDVKLLIFNFGGQVNLLEPLFLKWIDANLSEIVIRLRLL